MGREIVSLTEVKEYLRIDGEEEDALLISLIRAAEKHCENYLKARLPKNTPSPVKQALLILTGHFYEERTGENIPKAVYSLLAPYRKVEW